MTFQPETGEQNYFAFNYHKNYFHIRLVDSKTMLPLSGDLSRNQSLSRLQPGARRVFLCRMKSKQVKHQNNICRTQSNIFFQASNRQMSADINAAAAGKKKKIIAGDRKYVPILCTGYLKTWPLTQVMQLKILLRYI